MVLQIGGVGSGARSAVFTGLAQCEILGFDGRRIKDRLPVYDDQVLDLTVLDSANALNELSLTWSLRVEVELTMELAWGANTSGHGNSYP